MGCICNRVRCIQVVIWAGKSGFAEFVRNARKRSPISDQRVGLSSQLSAKWGLTTLLLLPRLETTQTASESCQKSTGAVQC